MSNSVTAFETISLVNLHTVSGGADPQPGQIPQGINGRDVLEVAGRATQTTLMRGRNIPGNLGQAYRQFNDPRVGNGFWDKAAYGFTGLFGIDPLKPR
jgi:hypothetical protein